MVQITSGTQTLVLTLHTDPVPLSPTSYTLKLTSETTRTTRDCTLPSPVWNTRTLEGSIRVNVGTANPELGYIDLKEPEFPAGFYVLVLYVNDSRGNTTEVGRSRANLTRTAGESGYVAYQAENTSTTNYIKVYEQ